MVNPRPDRREPPGDEEQRREWAKYAELGYLFIAAIALPTLAGYMIDRWFNSLP